MADPQAGLHQSALGGSTTGPAIGPMSEYLTAPVLPDLAYAAAKGWVFSASQAIAGVAPGTSGTTTTPSLTIYNGDSTSSPTVKVILLDWAAAYVSGTIGAGFIGGSLGTSASTPTGGTAITSYPLNGATSAFSFIACGTGHTVTALAAGTDREVVCDLAATLATAPAAGVGTAVSFTRVPLMRVIPAGSFYAFAGVTAAGSSPLLRQTIRYLVYPLPVSPSSM